MMSVSEAKAQARALRAKMAEDGETISHSAALELVARRHGARDWNTLSARLLNADGPRFALGGRVTGRYLGQAFAGEIVALEKVGSDYFRISLRFDAPVDVVTFDSFSALRHRVTATVGTDGRSPQKTSNGEPQMMID